MTATKPLHQQYVQKKDNKNPQQILDNDNITVERQGIFAKTKYVLDNLLTHNVFPGLAQQRPAYSKFSSGPSRSRFDRQHGEPINLRQFGKSP